MSRLPARAVAVAACTAIQGALAMEPRVEFEPRFLRPGASGDVDLSAFSLPAQALPGEYWLDTQVNGRALGRLLIPYRRDERDGRAHACFDLPLLKRLGVDISRLASADESCRWLPEWVAEADQQLDLAEQRLALQVPQAWLAREARDQVPVERWEAGVSSAFAGYDLSFFDVDSPQGGARTQGYAGLSSGVNLGAWQWRHQGALSSNGGYQVLGHYLQREVAPLGAQLRIGQLNTQGELFESVQMRGASLFSDDRMLPASQRGFAPVVRGVARSNARVAIRQGERLLRETVVPPGPYVIDDLYAATVGGDLQVTVTEADGSEQRFTVTNAAAPLALRSGQSRFSLGLGQQLGHQQENAPWFAQGAWQQGFNDTLTGYSGAILATDYQQALLGAALNTPMGAMGLDVAQARTRDDQGHRARLSWGHLLADSDTRLGLSVQHAFSPGYQSLAQAGRAQGKGTDAHWRERTRATLNLNQPLGSAWGQLNVSAWRSSGWEQSSAFQGYSLSYAHRFSDLGYALSASRERDAHGRDSTLWQLSMNMPLGGSRGSLTSGLSHSPRLSQGQVGYRNTHGPFNYGASVSASQPGDNGYLNAYAGWREPYGEYNVAAGQGAGSRQLSASARGAVVAHGGGVTLAQPLGETFGIVQVPEAKGARLVNGSELRVDGRGFAIVPNLMPYQVNRVDIDPLGLPLSVELATNSQEVVPRAGAVTLLRYPTQSGRTALIHLRLADGRLLPFGAQVAGTDGVPLGVVGQGSRVLARGLKAQGQLRLQWGERGEHQCAADYALGRATEALEVISVMCEQTMEEAT